MPDNRRSFSGRTLRATWLAGLGTVLLDQVLKAAAVSLFPALESSPAWLPLVYVKNHAPYHGVSPLVPFMAWLAATAAFLILSRGHAWPPRFVLGAVLTLAGTGSNAANWLVPGYVVGYLRVPFAGLAFNLADVFALLGFALACSAAVSGLRPTQGRATCHTDRGR